jgi:hypothetical protein
MIKLLYEYFMMIASFQQVYHDYQSIMREEHIYITPLTVNSYKINIKQSNV